MREPRRRWQLDSPFALIQQIRLVHAIAESSAEIAVPADQLDKFSILRERDQIDTAERMYLFRPHFVDFGEFRGLDDQTV